MRATNQTSPPCPMKIVFDPTERIILCVQVAGVSSALKSLEHGSLSAANLTWRCYRRSGRVIDTAPDSTERGLSAANLTSRSVSGEDFYSIRV